SVSAWPYFSVLPVGAQFQRSVCPFASRRRLTSGSLLGSGFAAGGEASSARAIGGAMQVQARRNAAIVGAKRIERTTSMTCTALLLTHRRSTKLLEAPYKTCHSRARPSSRAIRSRALRFPSPMPTTVLGLARPAHLACRGGYPFRRVGKPRTKIQRARAAPA